MPYEWSDAPSPVPAPADNSAVTVHATKRWGQAYEQSFQLIGQLQVSDDSGSWSASTRVAELGAVREALESVGWEDVTFSTTQEVSRTLQISA